MHASKTEHHEGKGTRIIPLFPELRQCLEEMFQETEARSDRGLDEAPFAPTDPIIRRYWRATQNLRTQLKKIIRRAGLEPWPKLWQNLRSSGETELMQRFPAHVVVAWIGHTEQVAQKHYLQVTDEHFAAALEAVHESGAYEEAKGGHRQRKAVHSTSPQKRENPEEQTTCGNSSGFGEWALLDPNLLQNHREIKGFLRKALQNPVQLAHGAVQTVTCRPSLTLGPSSPRKPGQPCWRWWPAYVKMKSV